MAESQSRRDEGMIACRPTESEGRIEQAVEKSEVGGRWGVLLQDRISFMAPWVAFSANARICLTEFV